MAPRRIIPFRRDEERDEGEGEVVGEVDSDHHYKFVDYPNAEPRNVEDSILRDFGLDRRNPHGRGKLGGHFASDPFARWGNKKTVQQSAGSLDHPVREFLFCELDMPAEISLRLSATSSAPAATFAVTWNLLIGVGSAMQSRQVTQTVTLTVGPPTDDLYFKFPIKVLRISASVHIPVAIGAPRTCVIVAHAAPVFAQFPAGVHR
jgi:hypothetical protein